MEIKCAEEEQNAFTKWLSKCPSPRGHLREEDSRQGLGRSGEEAGVPGSHTQAGPRSPKVGDLPAGTGEGEQ